MTTATTEEPPGFAPPWNGAPPPAPPSRRGGFFGWAARKPKVAFFSTLGLALLVGIGIGAAPQSGTTSKVTSLQAQLTSAKGDLANGRTQLGSAQGQLTSTQDQLSTTRASLRTTKRKLKAANAATARMPGSAPAPGTTITSSHSGAGVSFSGSGEKNIGTVTVPVESVLKWHGGGGDFTVINDVNDQNTIDVTSTASSGETTVSAGTYHKVDILALSDWSFTITPK